MPLVTDLAVGRWMPGVLWARQDTQMNTRIVWAATMGTRNQTSAIRARLQFFSNGAAEPDYIYESPVIPFGTCHSLDLKTLLEPLGKQNYDGYAVVQTWVPNEESDFTALMETWCDYFTSDGKSYFSVPALPMIGSRRVPVPGQCIVDTFPGIVCNKDYRSRVVWMNPYSAAIKLTVRVSNSKGKYIESKQQIIAPRRSGILDLAEAIPDLENFLASNAGTGHLMLIASFSLRYYVLYERKSDQSICSMDHTVPYLYFYNQKGIAKISV